MMHWFCKKFQELDTEELYKIIQLRVNVFVVKQNCAYPELDDKDLAAHHVYSKNNNNEITSYARILPPGISYKEISIGRVCCRKDLRLTGLGKTNMMHTLNYIHNIYGKVPIRISAQLYLKKFYEAFHFIPQGESYLEDNIPHIEMLRV